ncbi:mannosyltransferase [Aquimarina sp. W85]|uniref:mannosyltransferase n=1 Tax=Aquimarina rhodophyticola TaxID=3342246 RepID=UPI00366DC8C9
MILNFEKYRSRSTLFLIFAILFYLVFAYLLKRTDFVTLLLLWCSLFLFSYKIVNLNKDDFIFLGSIGILFRLLFLFATPNLSQDFYRFIWDGRLLIEGFNPYLTLPASWIAQGNVPIAQAEFLYTGMGALNASHYTNYPPISQLCYSIAALVANKSILGATVVLRCIIIMADIGILYFGKKILNHLKLPTHHIFIYFLNPFIIIELTGNLHFEAVMIFFLAWAFYLFTKEKWQWAAVVLGLSISVKLVPLLLLPLFFQYFVPFRMSKTYKVLNIWRLLLFYTITVTVAILTFIPFISIDFINNFTSTIALWFQSFEFNASFYYIIRWLGYQIVGWNIIGTVGKILPVISIIGILSLSFLRKNITTPQLITAMLFAICFYLCLSTTVHPWYLTTPLFLSIFTIYRFVFVWTLTVVLSYSAYAEINFSENLALVALEYLLVMGIFIFEIFQNKKLKGIRFEN